MVVMTGSAVRRAPKASFVSFVRTIFAREGATNLTTSASWSFFSA
jgi:hypothetical protein